MSHRPSHPPSPTPTLAAAIITNNQKRGPYSLDARLRDPSGVPAVKDAGIERRRCVSILDVGMTIPITNSRPARVTVRGAGTLFLPHPLIALLRGRRRRKGEGNRVTREDPDSRINSPGHGGAGCFYPFSPPAAPRPPALPARLAVRMSTHASEGVSKRTESNEIE
jgi:hypothetical protein